MDKYQIATNIALAGLDSFEGKMSAAQQRQIFGASIFGKKDIRIDNTGQGMVTVSFWSRLDYVSVPKSYDDIVRAVETGYISF